MRISTSIWDELEENVLTVLPILANGFSVPPNVQVKNWGIETYQRGYFSFSCTPHSVHQQIPLIPLLKYILNPATFFFFERERAHRHVLVHNHGGGKGEGLRDRILSRFYTQYRARCGV